MYIIKNFSLLHFVINKNVGLWHDIEKNILGVFLVFYFRWS